MISVIVTRGDSISDIAILSISDSVTGAESDLGGRKTELEASQILGTMHLDGAIRYRVFGFPSSGAEVLDQQDW